MCTLLGENENKNENDEKRQGLEASRRLGWLGIEILRSLFLLDGPAEALAVGTADVEDVMGLPAGASSRSSRSHVCPFH